MSNNKLLLSHELLSFIFDHLPSAYSIAHNCGTTWRFWFSDSVVPTFVRTVKYIHIFYLHTHYKQSHYLSPSTVEELFTKMRKEFGEFNKESRKVNELRLLEQREWTYDEYVQIFKKVLKESGYEGRPLIEEFKRRLNGNIWRRLAEAESPFTTIEEWWERSVRLDRNLRQSRTEEKVLGEKRAAQVARSLEVQLSMSRRARCNKTAGELGNLWWRNILFLFHFHLLCNNIKCIGHYDSKGVHEIIWVDKY